MSFDRKTKEPCRGEYSNKSEIFDIKLHKKHENYSLNRQKSEQYPILASKYSKHAINGTKKKKIIVGKYWKSWKDLDWGLGPQSLLEALAQKP